VITLNKKTQQLGFSERNASSSLPTQRKTRESVRLMMGATNSEFIFDHCCPVDWVNFKAKASIDAA
jgi:hypothetical protein